jgi:hypothetical protein
MKFKCENSNHYYLIINFNNTDISYDRYICNLLNIEYNEYINFMGLYNAKLRGSEYFFNNKSDCLIFIEKLKQKFSDKLVYLSLIEYTSEASNLINLMRKK